MLYTQVRKRQNDFLSKNDFLENKSKEHLINAGLKEAQVVYDIGCGTGLMTVYIASIVGPTGHVYAIDKSLEQLEIAQINAQEAHLTNVTFIQKDILDISPIHLPQADMVYARLLLMHLRQPVHAIQNMIKCLKRGGILALQESTSSTAHVLGDMNQLQKLVWTVLELGNALGVDYDMGLRIEELVHQQGLKSIQQYEHQFQLPPPSAREFLMMTHSNLLGRAITEGIITLHEFTEMGEDIQKLKMNFCTPKQIYLTAQKCDK